MTIDASGMRAFKHKLLQTTDESNIIYCLITKQETEQSSNHIGIKSEQSPELQRAVK